MNKDSNTPDIKIIALSNVFTRLMHFKKAGDIEKGHKHTYDHATLVSSGSVKVDMLDDTGHITNSKNFYAPNLIFINKENNHRITSLEDNTVCCCIHAIRTMDEKIVDPAFIMEPVFSTNKGEVKNLVKEKYNQEWCPVTK